MLRTTLEIACFNLESAITAQQAGANRIELCEAYTAGGITPSQELISQVKQQVSVPVHVIIRPRGGDFVYDAAELKQMEEAIAFCKSKKMQGVVLGVLKKNNTIDADACKRLIALARPMSVTFHRAIDQTPDPGQSFQQLIDLGVNRVLTSGGRGQAIDNVYRLHHLQQTFGKKIIIMPGGGVRSTNITQLMTSGCSEFHSAAVTDQKNVSANPVEIASLQHFLSGRA